MFQIFSTFLLSSRPKYFIVMRFSAYLIFLRSLNSTLALALAIDSAVGTFFELLMYPNCLWGMRKKMRSLNISPVSFYFSMTLQCVSSGMDEVMIWVLANYRLIVSSL